MVRTLVVKKTLPERNVGVLNKGGSGLRAARKEYENIYGGLLP